ncbi:MAG: hypothetical protein ACI8UC_001401 [Psychromonas sp.]
MITLLNYKYVKANGDEQYQKSADQQAQNS